MPRDKSYAAQQRYKRILAASDVCHICGETGADAIDHVIPIARGGAEEFWNLKPAHHNSPNSKGVKCNRSKGKKLPDLNLTTSRRW